MPLGLQRSRSTVVQYLTDIGSLILGVQIGLGELCIKLINYANSNPNPNIL